MLALSREIGSRGRADAVVAGTLDEPEPSDAAPPQEHQALRAELAQLRPSVLKKRAKAAGAAAEVQRTLSRQELSVDNLVAGAHAHPSILLAKDLYAEKLRSMRLQRELSSSRVKLRKSMQREKDARRAAVKKRNQAAKSVWALLERASKSTQRMPPLALS